MRSALDQIEVLAQRLIDEPDDRMRSPVDFHAMEANERHEGRRDAGGQILSIVRKERLTPERIRVMSAQELTERITRLEALVRELQAELSGRPVLQA